MKPLLFYLRALSFLFAFLYVNLIYSQSPCGVTYSITVTYVSDCNYTFTPVLPVGAPTVDWYHWLISSSGTHSIGCDTFATSRGAPTLSHIFCFSGNHDILLTIHFANGTSCTVTATVNVTCTTGIVCDPDPTRTAAIPDPLVEITYVGIDNSCGTKQNQGWHDCMWQFNGSNFNIACGWIWQIKIVPSTSNCEYFTYHLQYVSIDPNSSPAGASCSDDSACVYQTLTPGTDYCIHAKLNEGIVIWADGNSCCLPLGYQTGYIWTPVPGCSPGTICAPSSTQGSVCNNRGCPHSACTETQTAMNNIYLPATHCFTGGKRIEQRNSSRLLKNSNIEQYIIIYNLDGIEIFRGNWKFGDPSNAYLNWPKGILPGLYLVKFQKAVDEGLTKMYKIN